MSHNTYNYFKNIQSSTYKYIHTSYNVIDIDVITSELLTNCIEQSEYCSTKIH